MPSKCYILNINHWLSMFQVNVDSNTKVGTHFPSMTTGTDPVVKYRTTGIDQASKARQGLTEETANFTVGALQWSDFGGDGFYGTALFSISLGVGSAGR